MHIIGIVRLCRFRFGRLHLGLRLHLLRFLNRLVGVDQVRLTLIRKNIKCLRRIIPELFHDFFHRGLLPRIGKRIDGRTRRRDDPVTAVKIHHQHDPAVIIADPQTVSVIIIISICLRLLALKVAGRADIHPAVLLHRDRREPRFQRRLILLRKDRRRVLHIDRTSFCKDRARGNA